MVGIPTQCQTRILSTPKTLPRPHRSAVAARRATQPPLAGLSRRSFDEDGSRQRRINFLRIVISGLQDELTGTEKGTDVVFLHTTVDDGGHFQQILAWTLKSRWQKQNQQLREVTASFRSVK